MNKIERIKQIVKDEKLDQRSKLKKIVHKRWYCYTLLRNENLRLYEIGKILNVHHATILYGIKQAEFFTSNEDTQYLTDTHELHLEFGDEAEKREQLIAKCQQIITDLQSLQTKIKISLLLD